MSFLVFRVCLEKTSCKAYLIGPAQEVCFSVHIFPIKSEVYYVQNLLREH